MKPKTISATTKENRIFIALGTNLADRRKNLKTALKEIEKIAVIVKKSSVYETKPMGYTPQDDFLNMVIQIKTNLSPQKLLTELKNTENKMGRTKTIKNGPRIIDLDILIYGDKKIRTKNLTIPHPRMNERQFVLIPLNEII